MKRVLSIAVAVLLLLVALPAVAEGDPIQAGLYVSDAGTEYMYLNDEGVGVLSYSADGLFYACGIVWTENSLEIEKVDTACTLAENVLSFTFEDTEYALRYSGKWENFALGDRGTNYAGNYSAGSGKTLTLTADGRGVYKDGNEEQEIFWGSLMPYWNTAWVEGYCFILYGSFLGGMMFQEETVTVDTEKEQGVVFYPQEIEEPAPSESEIAKITLVSPAFDLRLNLPTDRWTVEETAGGLMVSLEREMIQYTFISMELQNEPSAATLDAYADHIWTDCLMGSGAVYDSSFTARGDYAVGGAAGRTASTVWEKDEVELKGDLVLWYANGRLYAAMSVSDETSRPEALAMLDDALTTIRPAEAQDLDWETRVYLDREVFEGIQVLPPAPVVTEQVYYGYRMTTGGQTIDLVPFMTGLGMDVKSICLVLRSDNTGSIQMMEEGGGEFTWDGETFTAEGESISYAREGEHIILTVGDEVVEFAPAAEIEALLAEEAPKEEKKEESVVPEAEALIGNWKFTKARAMGIEISADQMPTGMTLVLNEDGSAVLLTDGFPTEVDWEVKEDGTVVLKLAEAEVFTLSYDGTVLTLATGEDGVEMIFEKDVQ